MGATTLFVMTANAGVAAEVDEATLLPALRAGDERAFQRLTDRYRRELLVHCYRMLGSFHDAEDVLQETLLRAWRGLESFEGRSALRPWLYKIATNACLDVLASRRRRVLPNATHPPADSLGPMRRGRQLGGRGSITLKARGRSAAGVGSSHRSARHRPGIFVPCAGPCRPVVARRAGSWRPP